MLKFRIKRTLKMGIKSLWVHKLRSILTALGHFYVVALRLKIDTQHVRDVGIVFYY